jgi:hypothetical protein
MERYIKRQIEKEIGHRCDRGFIVAILGARQVGKTTLLNHIKDRLIEDNPSFFFSFDDPILRAKIRSDFYFLKTQIEDSLGMGLREVKEPVFLFIDEAQKLPQVFELLKIFYDEYKGKLKIIVSGSASLEIQKKGAESLAGRISYLYLMPLSIREMIEEKIGDTLGRPLWEELARGNLTKLLKGRQKELLGQKDTFELILRKVLVEGSLPGVYIRKEREEKNLVLQSFASTYLDKDIRALREVGSLDDFTRMLSLFSFEIGSLFNLASCSKDLGISINTLKKYYSILVNTFVINPLLPYFVRGRKRLVRSKKLYFFDIGVANFLAKRESLEHMVATKTIGPAFENLILKSFESFNKNRSLPWSLSFFRDYAGYEMDLVIELGNLKIGVEISYSEELPREKMKNFEYFFNSLQSRIGLLVYRGRVQEVDLGCGKVICLPWWLWW